MHYDTQKTVILPFLESPLLVYSSVRLWCASRVPPVRCQSLFSSPSWHPQTSLPLRSLQLLAQTLSPKAHQFSPLEAGRASDPLESWVYLNGGGNGGESEAGQVLHKGKSRGVKLPFLSPSSWAWQTFKIIKNSYLGWSVPVWVQ